MHEISEHPLEDSWHSGNDLAATLHAGTRQKCEIMRGHAVQNETLAERFDEIADYLELMAENPFRVRTYRVAARMLRNLSESVTAIARDPKRHLHDLPGIGKDLEGKIQEMLRTGHLHLLDELRAKTPKGLREILRIPGIGPKKAHRLIDELGIHDIAGLKQAAERHRIAQMEGFGPKSEKRLLKDIATVRATSTRILRDKARDVVNAIHGHLKNTPGLKHLAVAGSYRRGYETTGDLDFLAVATDSKVLLQHLQAYPDFASVESQGSKSLTIRLKSGFQVDLRIIPELSWGAAQHCSAPIGSESESENQ